MKIMAMAVILALLPLMGEAQRGATHGGGSTASRGGTYSAPARSYTPAPSHQPQPGRQAARSSQNAAGQNRYSSSHPAYSAPRQSVGGQNELRGGSSQHQHHIWWGGGIYLGVLYAPGFYGWYMPYYGIGLAADPFYGGYEEYLTAPGIKFDLSQVKGSDKKAIEDAGVYLPDGDGKDALVGSVKNFSGWTHHALPLAPGTYNVSVVLADSRKIEVPVMVQPQHVTTVLLLLSKDDD
jgi:hypothetical protein